MPSTTRMLRAAMTLVPGDPFTVRDDDVDVALTRVLRDDGSADPKADPIADDILMRAYREMRRLRAIDARMIVLQRQGRVGFYGACTGQEAVPIATGLALEAGDWVFPALREQSIMLVRGFPLDAFIAQVFGNSGDVLTPRGPWQVEQRFTARSSAAFVAGGRPCATAADASAKTVAPASIAPQTFIVWLLASPLALARTRPTH